MKVKLFFGRYVLACMSLQEDEKIHFHRGKVAKVVGQGGKIALQAEDTMTGKVSTAEVDMVVLATGLVPETEGMPGADLVQLDENGFITPQTDAIGIIGAGTVTQPMEVSATIQDSTGAALKGIIQLGKE